MTSRRRRSATMLTQATGTPPMWTGDQAADALLARGGFSDRLWRRAIATMAEAMEATNDDGHPDWAPRQRAVEQVLTCLGLKRVERARGDHGAGGAPVAARTPRAASIEVPYLPRPLQRLLHERLRRWNCVITHRRFGKTVLAINHLIRALVEHSGPRTRVAYIAPFLKQAKAIAWDFVKFYAGPIPDLAINESELRIDLPGERRLMLLGADNAHALHGLYLDGLVVDE
jgi:hypothetical protein